MEENSGGEFEGGMSELRPGGDLANAQREQARLQQQQEQQARQQRRQAMQARMRQIAERTAKLKKQAERIKMLKRARYARLLLVGCGGCLVPGLIIFACVAILAIAYGLLNETTAGQWFGNLLSVFSSAFRDVKDAMQLE